MMKTLVKIVSILGLTITLVPPLLHLYGVIEPDAMKTYMFLGALLWFAGAIPWLGRKKAGSS